MSHASITHARTTDEEARPCHCGTSTARCVACGAPRCLSCDPYVSDDCDGPATAAPVS
ncbi:hypothetical protein ACN3XK_72720 [Actinomadura welshii]